MIQGVGLRGVSRNITQDWVTSICICHLVRMDMADGLGKHDNPVRVVVFFAERCGDISFGESEV